MKNTKRMFLTRSVILLAAILMSSFSVSAKTGSYVLEWEGEAPAQSMVHITATSSNGVDYSHVFTVGGMMTGEVGNMIISDLRDNGWYVMHGAPNEVVLMGRIAGSSFDQIGTHYATSTMNEGPLINAYLRGYTELQNEVPLPGNFEFKFAAPIVDTNYPPMLQLEINGESLSSDLQPGVTIPMIVSSFEGLVMSLGLETGSSEGSVSLDWGDPLNQEVLGQIVKLEIGALNGAGGPHITLGLPGENVMSYLGVVTHPLGSTVFPPQGGELKYYVGVGNDGITTIDGYIWVEVTALNGEYPYPESLPMMHYMLDSEMAVNEEWTLNIPATIPSGNYNVIVHYGDPDPSNETSHVYDMFQFEKRPVEISETPDRSYTTTQQLLDLNARRSQIVGYPNPFNPEATLTFTLAQNGPVTLAVYDVAGREVAHLVDGYRAEGVHQVTFNGQGLPSGMYFAKLTAGSQVQITKLMLLK